MGSVLDIFKVKRTVEHPPIGRLTFVRGGWQTEAPPPPLDSGGLLRFQAGEAGPSRAQLDAFDSLAAAYGELLPTISARLFSEYRAAAPGYELLPAASPSAMPGVTRLMVVVVRADGSATLSYGLYFYHPPSQAVELLDHQLNVVVRDGAVTDVMFEG
jgi:hypothetical protein